MSNNFKAFENFEDVLKNGMIFKALDEGKHTCQLVDLIPVNYAATSSRPAVTLFKLQLRMDDKRLVSSTLNKTGIEILFNELYKQLQIQEDISIPNLLALAQSKQSLDVWVVRKTVIDEATREPRTYTNYRFVEPKNNQKED